MKKVTVQTITDDAVAYLYDGMWESAFSRNVPQLWTSCLNYSAFHWFLGCLNYDVCTNMVTNSMVIGAALLFMFYTNGLSSICLANGVLLHWVLCIDFQFALNSLLFTKGCHLFLCRVFSILPSSTVWKVKWRQLLQCMAELLFWQFGCKHPNRISGNLTLCVRTAVNQLPYASVNSSAMLDPRHLWHTYKTNCKQHTGV